jgi:ribosomal protein S18 acetylase RimI-like enzyme
VVFVPQQSQLDDIADWRSLAREVESLFGQAMAEEPAWEEHLSANIQRGTAWCVRDTSDRFAGGMWLSYAPDGCLHIDWLAVARRVRRRGAGRALVVRALREANGRPTHVITFGAGHPGGSEAEAARGLYRGLGFLPLEHEPAADGTPRDLFVLARAPDE